MGSNKPHDLFDSINDMLEGTKWTLMRPGRPKRIDLKGYECSQKDLEAIMNYYRNAGWIVKASVVIRPEFRNYVLEFINPYHN